MIEAAIAGAFPPAIQSSADGLVMAWVEEEAEDEGREGFCGEGEPWVMRSRICTQAVDVSLQAAEPTCLVLGLDQLDGLPSAMTTIEPL